MFKKKKKNSGGPGGKHRGNHKHGIGANAKPIINAVGKTGIENTDFSISRTSFCPHTNVVIVETNPANEIKRLCVVERLHCKVLN